MSSILKALQKLERDREARQAKPPDIQRGILRQNRRPGSRAPWTLPVAVLATALLAALGTYLLMGGGSRPGPQDASVPAASPVLPAPGAPEVIAVPQTQTPSIGADRPVLAAPRTVVAPPALNSDHEATPPGEAPLEDVPPAVSPPSAASAAPLFTVAGIGWRDDPASRMAMVNGSPVRVGSVVDGARVEEIFPDRVRFSYQQRSFEVQLGKSATP
jgi:general secretion pathway protein B